jgi:hypothetical protein
MIHPSQYFPPSYLTERAPEWFTECGPPLEQRQKPPVKRTAKTRNYERQQLPSGCVLLVMKIQKPRKENR